MRLPKTTAERPLLTLEIVDDVVHCGVAHVRLRGSRLYRAEGVFTSFRLLYLEIDASIVLHPDDAEYRADCLGSRAGGPDDLTHVILVDREHEQHLDNVLEKLLIFFHTAIVSSPVIRSGYVAERGASTHEGGD